MRVAAALLAFASIGCLLLAISDMVRKRDDERRGWLLRTTAFACFVAAVMLNTLAHS
jgi:hypothetical protein